MFFHFLNCTVLEIMNTNLLLPNVWQGLRPLPAYVFRSIHKFYYLEYV